MSETTAVNKKRLSEIRGLARETILNNPYAPVLITLVYYVVKFSVTLCFSGVLLSDYKYHAGTFSCRKNPLLYATFRR